MSSGSSVPGRICLIDLDRTLLAGRTIEHVGDRFGVTDRITGIQRAHHDSTELAAGREETVEIAALFEGVRVDHMREACCRVPWRDGAQDAIDGLRRLGFRTVVVSASYDLATQRAIDELGVDAAVAVRLEVVDERLTGRVVGDGVPGDCGQFICKAAVLETEAAHTSHPFTVAIGDGRNDVCMLERADLAIGIAPCADEVRVVADVVLDHLAALPGVIAHHMEEATTAGQN